eukprot:5421931-Amphidinium_carterae.2
MKSSPAGQLQSQRVPALLQQALRHREMLDQIAAERAVQLSEEQGPRISAIEAYQQIIDAHEQVIDEHEKLEKKFAEMESKFATLLAAQIKLSKKMEELQEDRSRLIKTNERLIGQIII